jgi:hypothetical protein
MFPPKHPKTTSHAFAKLLLILLIPIVLLGVGGLVVFPKLKTVIANNPFTQKLANLVQGGKNTLPDKTTGTRVRGTAGENFPYGEVQDGKVYTTLLNDEGGVLAVDLPKNIKAYLIVPPNYTGIGGDVFTITPYFSMPTSSKAPALPDTLGYGFDFEIENAHWEDIEPLYLVFDLDQGKTIAEITKDSKLSSFCLPTLNSFNPAGCALLKGVPLANHTNPKYAVVSPVRDLEHNDAMFMNSTIPIGYDNLIVVQITKQATYIPFPLSKELLTDLIHANKPGYTMPQVEALSQAVTNNIYYNDPVTFSNISKGLYAFGDPFETLKVLGFLPKFKNYLLELKTQAEKLATPQYQKATIEFDIDGMLGDADNWEQNALTELFAQLKDSSGLTSSNAYKTLTAVLQVRRMENENFAGAKTLRQEMATKIFEDVNYFLDIGNEPDVNSYLMIEAALWAKPEKYAKAGIVTLVPAVKGISDDSSEVTEGPTSNEFNNGISQDPDYSFLTDPTASEKGVVDRATDIALYPLNNPCTSTFGQVINAMKAADLIGRTDIHAKLIDLIGRKLVDDIRYNETQSWMDVLKECSAIQMLGINETYPCLDQLCKQKALNTSTKQICTTLMEKILKNFAWNEIKCQTFMDRNKSPEIPTDCGMSPDEVPPLCE